MGEIFNATFQIRRDTLANWIVADPVLEAGEPAIVLGTQDFRVGDGITKWSLLPIIGKLPYRIEYGTAEITGITWLSVSFTVAFSTTPVVTVSYANNTPVSGTGPLSTRTETPTGFQVGMLSASGSGTRTVNWIAVGV